MAFAKTYMVSLPRKSAHFYPLRVHTFTTQECTLLPPKSAHSYPLKVHTLTTSSKRLVEVFSCPYFLFLYDYKQITV